MEYLPNDILRCILNMIPKELLNTVANSFMVNKKLNVMTIPHIKLIWEQYHNFISFNNKFSILYDIVEEYNVEIECQPIEPSKKKWLIHDELCINLKELSRETIIPYSKVIVTRFDNDGELLTHEFPESVKICEYYITICIEKYNITMGDILYLAKQLAKPDETCMSRLDIIEDSHNVLTLEAFPINVC